MERVNNMLHRYVYFALLLYCFLHPPQYVVAFLLFQFTVIGALSVDIYCNPIEMLLNDMVNDICNVIKSHMSSYKFYRFMLSLALSGAQRFYMLLG